MVMSGENEKALEDAAFVLISLNDSENPGALLVQANALYAMGDFEHALVSYRRALRQDNALMCEKEEILVDSRFFILCSKYFYNRMELNKQRRL